MTRSSAPLAWAAALALALGLAVEGAGPAAAEEMIGPTAVIEDLVDRALAILDDRSLTKPQRVAALEELALDRFDFRTMSKLVLARDWKRFSEEQQDEFRVEFKNYLSHSYSSRLDRYNQEKIRIQGERAEPRGDVTVLTTIVGGEFDSATVNYRLRNRSGRWLVIDVVVEGISFVSNYRDQFREVLSHGGPDHLLQKLREKNLEEVDSGQAG